MDVRRRVHAAARRVARGVPPAVREVGMALAARTVDGPALLPGPPPGPVLVLAPHPDDETIGVGGTLARHADRGDDITILVATSGEATGGGRGDVGAAREAECLAACERLGVTRPPIFLRLPDGDLASGVEVLAERLRHHGADAEVIYAPSVLDPHPDHRAANVGVARAALRGDIYGYEVWSPAPVDVLLDVDAVYDRKEAALRCYTTALETVDYVRTAAGLAAYRSAAGGLGGTGHAEGFVRLRSEEHAALTHRAGLLGPGGGAAVT
jgi:LmbE family N-acetylglucosaminyl deacetylase